MVILHTDPSRTSSVMGSLHELHSPTSVNKLDNISTGKRLRSSSSTSSSPDSPLDSPFKEDDVGHDKSTPSITEPHNDDADAIVISSYAEKIVLGKSVTKYGQATNEVPVNIVPSPSEVPFPSMNLTKMPPSPRSSAGNLFNPSTTSPQIADAEVQFTTPPRGPSPANIFTSSTISPLKVNADAPFAPPPPPPRLSPENTFTFSTSPRKTDEDVKFVPPSPRSNPDNAFAFSTSPHKFDENVNITPPSPRSNSDNVFAYGTQKFDADVHIPPPSPRSNPENMFAFTTTSPRKLEANTHVTPASPRSSHGNVLTSRSSSPRKVPRSGPENPFIFSTTSQHKLDANNQEPIPSTGSNFDNRFTFSTASPRKPDADNPFTPSSPGSSASNVLTSSTTGPQKFDADIQFTHLSPRSSPSNVLNFSSTSPHDGNAQFTPLSARSSPGNVFISRTTSPHEVDADFRYAVQSPPSNVFISGTTSPGKLDADTHFAASLPRLSPGNVLASSTSRPSILEVDTHSTPTLPRCPATVFISDTSSPHTVEADGHMISSHGEKTVPHIVESPQLGVSQFTSSHCDGEVSRSLVPEHLQAESEALISSLPPAVTNVSTSSVAEPHRFYENANYTSAIVLENASESSIPKHEQPYRGVPESNMSSVVAEPSPGLISGSVSTSSTTSPSVVIDYNPGLRSAIVSTSSAASPSAVIDHRLGVSSGSVTISRAASPSAVINHSPGLSSSSVPISGAINPLVVVDHNSLKASSGSVSTSSTINPSAVINHGPGLSSGSSSTLSTSSSNEDARSTSQHGEQIVPKGYIPESEQATSRDSSAKNEQPYSKVRVYTAPSEFTGQAPISSVDTVSITEPPPKQLMENTSKSAYRIPSHVFARNKSTNPADWSGASNESLFSIQMGNTSFTGDFFPWRTEDLNPSGEASTSGQMFSYAGNSESKNEFGKVRELGVAQAAFETMKEVLRENEENQNNARATAEHAWHNPQHPGASGNNTKPFAGSEVEGDMERGQPGYAARTGPEKPHPASNVPTRQRQPESTMPSMQQQQQPQSQPCKEPEEGSPPLNTLAAGTRWFHWIRCRNPFCH